MEGAYAGSKCLEDRPLVPGSAIGMYRLYDAGGVNTEEKLIAEGGPEEGPRGP